MEKPIAESIYLRKLIDVPKSIVRELKNLAIDSDKSVKTYIQDLIKEDVLKHRLKQ
ncbi:hypothetical protein BH09BAC3_BH09BAC3_27440 [soil metagenome]